MTRVSTEKNGRFTEIYVEGIPDGSIAFDAENKELIVDCDNFRRREDNAGFRGIIAELPDEPMTYEKQ